MLSLPGFFSLCVVVAFYVTSRMTCGIYSSTYPLLLCEYHFNLSDKLELSSGCQPVIPCTSENTTGGSPPNIALLLAALHIFSAVPPMVMDIIL